MNHNHKEECKHEKLKYCKECDVVECECGREWFAGVNDLIGYGWTVCPSAIIATSCLLCNGTGIRQASCPDEQRGCLVYHTEPCECRKSI